MKLLSLTIIITVLVTIGFFSVNTVNSINSARTDKINEVYAIFEGVL